MSDAEHPTSSHVSLLLPPKDLLEDGLVARRPWQACVAPQRRVVLLGLKYMAAAQHILENVAETRSRC